MKKKVLLLYITKLSGHHSASIAVEKAINIIDADAEVLNINAFSYTNPIWESIINRAYMSVVRNKPEIWDYLYDNPRVLTKVKKIREVVHRTNINKIKGLVTDFKPDVIACTQAYPCGMVADYKKVVKHEIPLVGILTDFAPHSYWVYENVNSYIVPSNEAGHRLIGSGILKERVKPFGIPVDPKYFSSSDKEKAIRELGLDASSPIILIMGGGQGLGPIRDILTELDTVRSKMQILVVTGTNKKLFSWISSQKFNKKIIPYGYIDFVDKLMSVASLIVTKPGGVTVAEALSKYLPMIIVNPLPGQETMNTKFLVKEECALKADNEKHLAELISIFLNNPDKLKELSDNIRSHAKPDAAMKIAEMLLGFR